MTPEQKAAFINAAVARYLAEIAGMQAENQRRISLGYSIAYDEKSFGDLERRHPDVQHNTICAFFRD